MPKWCVESYPSSLYKFEKTRFWHFVIISGRGQGGPNPCLVTESVTSNNQARLMPRSCVVVVYPYHMLYEYLACTFIHWFSWFA